MTAVVSGTFASGQSAAPFVPSDVLVVPDLTTNIYLTLTGDIDANNTVRRRRSLDNGQTWANGTTYTAPISGVSVLVTAGDQWSFQTVLSQPGKTIGWKISAEGP
jgi:hypothetical protein